jgi:hypothetical protein
MGTEGGGDDDSLVQLLVAMTLPDDAPDLLESDRIGVHHLELAREAELRMKRLRLQIKAHLADVRDGHCHCGEPLEGRADRVYCSANCREAARRRRSRRGAPPRVPRG